jgi:hypothetical protein
VSAADAADAADAPLSDTPLAIEDFEPSPVPLAVFEGVSAGDLYIQVADGRQKLLETRLDVVRKANEGKQRKEELAALGRISPQTIESLRKDLETVKEAQRVMATVLSDITNATTSNDVISDAVARFITHGQPADGDRDAGHASEPRPKAEDPDHSTDVTDDKTDATDDKIDDAALSRVYLENIIRIYESKTRQLTRIAEAIDGVARVK